MGLLTLADFKDELQLVLGNRGFSNTQLSRWLNFGYYHACAEGEWEALRVCATIDTVDGTGEYGVPDRMLAPISLADTTSEYVLRFTELSNIHRASRSSLNRGRPRLWSRRKGALVFWPVPDGVYHIDMYYVEEPPKLTLDTDVTVLPRRADPVVLRFSAHYGFDALDEPSKANDWLTKAEITLGKIRLEMDYQAETPNAGFTIARSEYQLTHRKDAPFGDVP